MSKLFEYVSYLNVSLSSGSDRDYLYANERNQVALIIDFVVTDINYNQIILTKEQILQCVFVGDYHTGKFFSQNNLSDGWIYSDEPGEFITASIQHLECKEALTSEQNSQLQHQTITYYMGCKEYEVFSRTFCAFLTPDNFDTYFTTGLGTQFDSGVTITPRPPISYDYTDLDFERVDDSSADYGNHHVDQDDYYASIPSIDIKKTVYSVYTQANYYLMDIAESEYRQYCYNVGPEGTYDIILEDKTRIPLVYNKRAGKLNLIRLSISSATASYLRDDKCYISIFDIYGNRGYLHFYPTENGNRIEMENA
ncbi:hypothetical protein [Pseudocitrobacter corydidari]|uniref:Uncharacterized protein n=1 Tax=Pseudocitrobacter corydidari TaxID=2891570 RepID=A0ABY3S7N1_9ENTR|nr:hypothetical protein [Pseudocitrobacter corydidari]UGS42161.1 hypothetical protein G163CM_28860 [Pseudocitrobacter corydidari]